MNPALEKIFVNTFIVPRKRERVLQELSRADKRENCMWRFESYFIPECVHKLNGIRAWVPEDNVDAVRNLGGRGDAYLFRPEPELCRIMPWEEAVREVASSASGFVFMPEAMLCYFVGEDFNYAKTCLYFKDDKWRT